MAWTEQDYQEIVARLMASSIGVNEVPNADKADDVTSLPAFKPSGNDSKSSVVNYPLEFLKGEQGEPGIQGEPGKSFKVAGEYATLEALKSAVPDGSAVDGFMAVGTEVPYDYYAWVNGEWISQGKIGGIDEAPTDGKAYGRKNGDWAEVPAKSDVLTKTNSESFTPTGDYQPATKKYADNIGYGKVIDADSGTISNDLTGKGLNLTGVDAEERVNRYFGNLGNFRSVVQDIIENHTRYFIHNSNDCRELGCLNVWKNTGNTEHELHFILTGFGDGNLHTKRYSIRITENTDDARFIIVNIIASDNLTTLTKKTAAEYEAIGSKDANTAYCVTD